MPSDALALAQRAIEAWRNGDFQTLKSMLDPGVQWRWFEPGDWDCHSRDDVMRTLRQRYEQGFGRGSQEFVEPGNPEQVVIVYHPREIGGPEWPEETATVMTFSANRVIDMQDYRSQAEALRAVQ